MARGRAPASLAVIACRFLTVNPAFTVNLYPRQAAFGGAGRRTTSSS